MSLRLRRGTDRDELRWRLLPSARKAEGNVPMAVHTDDEERQWITEHVVPHTELRVAEDDDGAPSASWSSTKTGSISGRGNNSNRAWHRSERSGWRSARAGVPEALDLRIESRGATVL